jgi:hypothetical protein
MSAAALTPEGPAPIIKTSTCWLAIIAVSYGILDEKF